MCRKDGGHVEVTRSGENKANAGLPLVKLCHKEGLHLLVLFELLVNLLEEPGDEVAKDQSIIRLTIMSRDANVG